MLSAAQQFCYYFAIFILDPFPTTRTSYPFFCIGMGVIAIAETSAVAETFVVRCIGFPQQKPHLERGNYYADKLLF